jgi:hypothetical protein
VRNALTNALNLPAKTVFLWLVWMLLLFFLASSFLVTFGEALNRLGALDMVDKFR